MQVNISGLDKRLGQLFSSGEYESLLIEVRTLFQRLRGEKSLYGKALFEPISDRWLHKLATSGLSSLPKNLDSNTIVHLASHVYVTGGHTRVFEDIVAALPDKKHILILTSIMFDEIFRTQLPLLLHERFRRLGVNVIFLLKSGLIERADELRRYLEEIKPGSIFINSHHEDVVIHSVVSGLSSNNVNFLHHADHLPCLGATRSDYNHIDLTAECHRVCKTRFTPSPFMLNMAVPYSTQSVNISTGSSDIVAVTSGAYHKFQGSLRYTYPAVLEKLLAGTISTFYHIGDVPSPEQTFLREYLDTRGIHSAKLIFMGNVPSLIGALQEISPTFYLESFPVGGGKARVEVLGAGIPILRIQPDETLPLFRWIEEVGPSTVVSDLEGLLPAVDEIVSRRCEFSTASRRFYDENHSFSRFENMLRNVI
ncbi:hypothetical protein AB3G45_28355 [Shinella sp. S4-D37]|uniref:hypothetical protein n=1 Tax=Shinella sp. S4-D37 TaxID=3161999 RepID=UPI00346523C8